MLRKLQYGVLGSFFLASLAGCGHSESRVPLYQTKGQAYFAGKPAKGALLIFHPLGQNHLPFPPRARVEEDGWFMVETFQAKDGLPEGDYIVTVEWRLGGEEEGGDGRSLVPSKYTRKETSTLRVSVSATMDGWCNLPRLEISK